MPSIFSDEWRECLVAHYTSVLRADDKRTERTLRGVMLEAGFSEDELRHITVLATAHVDHMGADFVPDLHLVEPVMVAVAAPEPLVEVVEELVEALAEEAVSQPQEVLEALAEVEVEPEVDDAQDQEPPPSDDPGVTQLSLF